MSLRTPSPSFSAATDKAYSNMATSAAGSPAPFQKARKPTTTRGGFVDDFDGRVALAEAGAVCTAASLPILGNTAKAWLACRTGGMHLPRA